MDSQTVKLVSECFINPKFNTSGRKQPYYLSPGDLAMLSANYIQKGLLFTKPTVSDQTFDLPVFLQTLKNSLSLTLVYFYPLTGRLVTEVDYNRHTSLIYVDCDKGPGARFIHCSLKRLVSDILLPNDSVLKLFFDHDKAVNHDGHIRPLLTIQITELIDGVFIGVSMNHSVADGTSYWHFWNVWSEIHRQIQNQNQNISVLKPPVHEKFFPEGYNGQITLPFTDSNEFIDRYESPPLRERIFHFSSDAILSLKKRANQELEGKSENDWRISSLQALTAFIWKCITRARCLEPDQKTVCTMDANIRSRLDPSLPEGYFGNAVWEAKTGVKSEELLQNDFGWVASLLNKSVSELTDSTLRLLFEEWMKNPIIFHAGMFFDPNSILIGSSPRFDMYVNEFGLGKPVAVRSGSAHKSPGKVTVYPGCEGGGSMDLEICLTEDSMANLESDNEFMALITSSMGASGH